MAESSSQRELRRAQGIQMTNYDNATDETWPERHDAAMKRHQAEMERIAALATGAASTPPAPPAASAPLVQLPLPLVPRYAEDSDAVAEAWAEWERQVRQHIASK